jgi:hypothetical protein
MSGDEIGFGVWCFVIFAALAWLVCLAFEARKAKRRTAALWEAARVADRRYYAALWKYLNRSEEDHD